MFTFIITFLSEPGKCVAKINDVLLLYGRKLPEAGRTYNILVESINSVSALKPILRRHLQPSWNLAFAWVREERPTDSPHCGSLANTPRHGLDSAELGMG